jgi:cysteine-rich repeat protein
MRRSETPQAVGSFGDRTASTTTQAIFTTNIPVGSTVIVTIALNPVAGAITCSDPRGNTYAVDVDVTDGTGTTGVRSAVCSARVTTAISAGDLMTVSHTSTNRRAIFMMSVTGLAVSPVDKTATGTGNDTAPVTANTAATSQANEILIGAIGVETRDEALTAGNSFTSVGSAQSGTTGSAADNVATYAMQLIVAATGTYAAAGTLPGPQNREWAAAIVTYKGAGNCGDSTVDAGEQCDDGNTNNGDCCSSTCQFEAAGTVCRSTAGVCDVPGDLQRIERHVPRERLRRVEHGVPLGGRRLRRRRELHGIGRGVSGRWVRRVEHGVPLGGRRLRRRRELHGIGRGVSGRRLRRVEHSVPLGRRCLRRRRELHGLGCGMSGRRVRFVEHGVSVLGRRVRPGRELHGIERRLSGRFEEHGGLPLVGERVRRGRVV